jgi:hypothetical protein
MRQYYHFDLMKLRLTVEPLRLIIGCVIGMLLSIAPMHAQQQAVESTPKIEGIWIEEAEQCGMPGNNGVRISPSQIVGNEWGCSIIEGKVTSTRWELKARCSEDGEYNRPGDQVPISRVIIYLQHGRLTMAGNKPLSVNGSRAWRWEYGHRCGE